MEAPAPMPSEQGACEFARRLSRVVSRGLRQIGQPLLAGEEERGLTDAVLRIGDEGGWSFRFGTAAVELPNEMVRAWVQRVMAALPARGPEVAGLAKQLLKACFQPGPPHCRDSFVETDATGRCRRQEHGYDLARISGAHCVDCPHWRDFTPTEHLAWLGDRWHAGRVELLRHHEVYLPEDFRALRLWRPAGGADAALAAGRMGL